MLPAQVPCCVSRRSFCLSPKRLRASPCGGELGEAEGILRKGGEGYWGFGRPVSKEVSEVPVRSLQSLLSRCVEGALLTKEELAALGLWKHTVGLYPLVVDSKTSKATVSLKS